MSRKHFILIAEGIRLADIPVEAKQEVAEIMAAQLRLTNPNFDRQRFIAAATA